ncbi:lamin tail domain-containing protein [Natronomonas sp. F2-12]|uniref:Lamin tail domain-containing protein n=1 Tax=Natronomonas aquatica TaxID=2841590 RepID=A0A9R1CTC4_9EURY|nr:lamin tail domain-containing protein [Natronomonas aquatica]MCQ4334849.1 lamin tail domain-containing protein [Natronomonas aquatica]
MGRLPVIAIAVLLLTASVAGCTSIAPSQPDPDDSETGIPEDPASDETTESSGDDLTTSAAGTLEVHYIAVGQAASVLVIGPDGETMLIDSGHFNDDGEHVINYLDAHNIDRIDYLVTSHPDADHIGGHAEVITHLETNGDGVGEIYDSGITSTTQTYAQYLDAVETHDVTLYEARAGDTIPFEGVTAEILGPPEGYLDGEDRNENSLVVQLRHGQASFLFTGDAEADAERFLVNEYGIQLETTVLKAGHHGSSSSTGDRLLDAATPAAVVISSPYDSQYGHPHEETLNRLAMRSVPAYWTATHGNTVFQSNGTHVTVGTQQSAPTAPLSLRDGTPIELGASDSITQRAVINASSGTTGSTTATTDGGTSNDPSDGTDSALAITEIHADAEGDDRENLNDEYVVFENTGDTSLDLAGWTVQDESGATYTFPEETVLDLGETITLRTGSGDDTATERYWGSSRPIWNNDGDTVIVTNTDGEQVLTESYP